ncbi:MAG: type II toxin-antitoxin system RelE/ParE family toxin [Deltaproteobacteria bacterium]|nr:type II toxin-antitoxin system RelE/ParE family toxin [Deltaproteobacteria bacterium]
MTEKRVPYRVVLTDEAAALLETIAYRDRRIAGKLADSMEDLSTVPQLKGRCLRGEFAGCLSRHCLGNRFRIVYTIHEPARTVEVISLGIRKAGDRKDVYELTRKILNRLRGTK